MLRRISILAGLTTCLVVALFALASCGADTIVSNTDLQNAAGSGNGPGSGKWTPPPPTNQRQARQLYQTIETLVANTNKVSTEYDEKYPQCLNENGKLLESQENNDCITDLKSSWINLQNLFADYRAGADAYELFAQDSGDEEETPPAPDPPDPPKKDPPEKEDPEDDDDWSGCCYCLTCTYNIHNPEYAFFDLDVMLNN